MAEPSIVEISRYIAAKERIEKDIDYAGSIKMDYQQVTGTRYRLRFSEASDDE